jgi:transposase-like protein
MPILVERRLGPDLVAQLVDAYRAGASTRDLAMRHGVAKSSVNQVLRRQGIKLRPRGGGSK